MSSPQALKRSWWMPEGLWSAFAVGAGLLVALSLILVEGGQSALTITRVGLIACVIGLAMAAVVLFASSRRPFCAMCRQPQAQVQTFLIAATSASVCAPCSDKLGAAVLEARLQRRDPDAFFLSTTADLAAVGSAPDSRSWIHLLELALEASGSPNQFRAVARAAVRVGHGELVQRALERIPPDQSRLNDLGLLSLAYDAQDRFAEALAIAPAPDTDKPFFNGARRSNRVWFEMNLAPPAERLSQLLAESERACQEVAADTHDVSEADRDQVRAAVTATRAQLLIKLARLDDAAAVLEEGVRRDRPSELYDYARAMLQLARGEETDAIAGLKALISAKPPWNATRRRSERVLAQLNAS